jgi:hypothetical protein
MKPDGIYGPVRLISWLVLLLMVVAVLYAGAMAVTDWTGIGV